MATKFSVDGPAGPVVGGPLVVLSFQNLIPCLLSTIKFNPYLLFNHSNKIKHSNVQNCITRKFSRSKNYTYKVLANG